MIGALLSFCLNYSPNYLFMIHFLFYEYSFFKVPVVNRAIAIRTVFSYEKIIHRSYSATNSMVVVRVSEEEVVAHGQHFDFLSCSHLFLF